MIANTSICKTYLIILATFLTLLLNLDCICSIARLLFYKDPVFRGYVFKLLRDLRNLIESETCSLMLPLLTVVAIENLIVCLSKGRNNTHIGRGSPHHSKTKARNIWHGLGFFNLYIE